MANLRTDSPVSRRIAISFLQFLNSVEPSDGVDSEALDVAKECLAEVFKIDQSSNDSLSHCYSLVDIFNSYEANASPIFANGRVYDARSLPSGKNAEVSNESGSLDPDRTSEPHSSGEDELFGHFFGALEKIHYFKRMPDGSDDQTQLDRATYLFHNAFEEMQKAGCQTFDQKVLAETFKAQGNKAMQSNLYTEAIELYTFAIALHGDNAIYYCNRAAAYTQIHLYAEAVRDCLKSIEINPNYSKAYSRLGFAYYAQGKYRDAIDKGFMKALQLDPNNDSIKENIRVAEHKLREEQQRGGPGQSSTSTSRGSMSFNINGGLPSDFSNMFMNMAGNTFPGQGAPSGPHGESESGAHAPGFGLGGDASGTSFPFNLNGGLPSDFSSMFMNMSGNAFPGRDDVHGGPHGGGSESGAHEPGVRLGGRSFSSMPFNVGGGGGGGLPSDFGTMFMNMAGDTFTGQPVDGGLNGLSEAGARDNEPGIRVDVDVNVDVNELPEEFSDAFTSMMGTWAASGGDEQNNNNNGRSDAR